MNPQLPHFLSERLTRPLTGPGVGSRFEIQPRLGRPYEPAPADARSAAVLLLLYPYEDAWHVPLTLRPAHLPDHAGQVCLPGGAMERGETGRAAAIREFHEELGAGDVRLEVLGCLSPLYVQASHFRVEPWVAATARRPAFQPNAQEVERLLEVPLPFLLDPANLQGHQRRYQGQLYQAPHFDWQDCRIWGATCMMLGELITLLDEMQIEI